MKPIHTKPLLVSAFTSLLVIMLLLIMISLYGMQSINFHLDKIANQSIKKVQLTSEMLHAARERSILLHRMVLIDDPFDRDELSIEVNKFGARFADARIKLINMPLTEEEKLILAAQGRMTNIAVPLQRNVNELLINDDLENAKTALIEEAMPAQDNVLNELTNLIVLQNKFAENAVSLASKTYSNSQLIMIGLGIIGIFIGFIISRTFIKKITQTEKKLRQEKEKAQITFKSIGDAVITTNASGKIEYLNDKAESHMGVIAEDVIGNHISAIFIAHDIENDKKISDLINEQLHGNFESQISDHVDLQTSHNANIKIKLSLSPILDENNIVQGMIITFHDVTESFELMRKIELQATRDALTGLLNRREFERKVKQTLSLYDANTTHAFMIVDLDRFKIVNDTCGHQAGDELLKQLSHRLKKVIRKSDMFARLGGDEFAFFLPNIDESHAKNQSEELLKSVSSYRFLWQDKTFTLGASIGLIIAQPESSSYDSLYNSADTACYVAKNEGRNRIHLLSPQDTSVQKESADKNWVARLNKAIDEDDFYLYGQDIVPISTRAEGKKHIEILIRMTDDDRNVISPMAFIPTAERYNLMHKIDKLVVTKVCNFINQTPLDHTVYAVNLSGQTLSTQSTMEELISIIRDSNILPGRLCLEITETAAIANLEFAREFMESMQGLGCYIALDDFGSGLSSFSYLKNLPLDYIKIDGIFVKEMLEDKSSMIMVEAIHSVGKKLGLMTVAEFVENADTITMLKEIGVDFAQGYVYSEPELYIPPYVSGQQLSELQTA